MNWFAVSIIWFIFGACINAFIFAVRCDNGSSETDIWTTPKDVYKTTRMNWFGAIITYFAMFVIDPLWYIAKLIWWVFHVGRKR